MSTSAPYRPYPWHLFTALSLSLITAGPLSQYPHIISLMHLPHSLNMVPSTGCLKPKLQSCPLLLTPKPSKFSTSVHDHLISIIPIRTTRGQEMGK